MADQLRDDYDVVVLGGGAAGLSGGLMLARSRRQVVVIDAGAPRNAPAAGVHGLLARDGIRPAELLERGRAEVRHYGGHVVAGEVTAAARDDAGFTVALADGRSVRARRLLVATGLADELPDVPGLRERWGRDVVHCPYCHGWEVRDRAIGVLASGPLSVHQALLFRQLSDDVALFSHTMPPPAGEEAEQLAPAASAWWTARWRPLRSPRATSSEYGSPTAQWSVARRWRSRRGWWHAPVSWRRSGCVRWSTRRGPVSTSPPMRPAVPKRPVCGPRVMSPIWPPRLVPRRRRAPPRRPRSTSTWSARKPGRR